MKKTILDFNVNKKTVVLRCDFNVSIEDDVIIDDTRIVSSLKTINYILDNGGKLVILSHLGKVKTEADKEKYSLKIVYERLEELIPGKISFVPYTSSPLIKKILDDVPFGKGILLENTRFEDLNGKKESGCDDDLSSYWASLGDIFINDAFGTLHRAHASNSGIAKYLDSGIGFLVERELNELNKLDNPERPFVLVMGGAKISDKIKLISSLIEKVDFLLIGGAMANTFLKAKGYEIGISKYEEDYISYCSELLEKYGEKIILPKDFYCTYEFSDTSKKVLCNITDISKDVMALDIGEKTIKLFNEKIALAKTIFWNGPLGAYELDNYIKGTKEVLEKIDKSQVSILGGGDIVGCANKLGLLKNITYASTGGGASLEYLVDKNLPGLLNIKGK